MTKAKDVAFYVTIGAAVFIIYHYGEDHKQMGLIELKPGIFFREHWKQLAAFLALLWINIYWAARWFLARFAQRRTAGMTAFADRELDAGRLPIRLQRPGRKNAR
jgi:hypothetical protein